MKCLFFVFLLTTCCYGLEADYNEDDIVDFQDYVIASESGDIGRLIPVVGEWLMANQYLSFDGSTGYVTVPNNAAMQNGSGAISYSVWMNSGWRANDTIFNKGATIASPNIAMAIASYSITFGISQDSSNYMTVFSIPSFDFLNKWCHICGVWTGSTAKLFINAIDYSVDLDIVGTPNGDTSEDLFIGQFGDGGLFFNGSLDDLRIYKGIALTQAQVDSIYNGGNGKKYDIADAGAGLAFNLDEGTGNPVSIGTAALTGTITGGVTWQRGGIPFRYKSFAQRLLLKNKQF